ncbi:TVP38/TMEM64 family protein [Clostridium sp. MT-14]|uniref:TVP38/TMEM64 family membrane protein n=1 Tax=Clostridium aromativorans TaxID=2836848 RepID=A0ABS8N195_9CLOT|nr:MULTISPECIES: TVP38/TMEM64 family protein [Clostridium]KAA8667979.1 TVP38/TMEM64 family protein [Clostridium sp. HV4-5-A1G]MCC9293569.1 TVP38/TMEM64 family protein [Clostridium aromativorans]CAB1253584.1 TVP38/TMEM64 family inner membrane protein YdjZ [Clostridiaceae bacterium BL-3]
MRKNNKNFVKSIIFAILVLFIIIVLFVYKDKLCNINVYRIRSYIQSYGEFSAVVFIVMYTLRPLLIIFPASLMSIVAGNIFNSHIAVLLSMIGCFGSATVAFFLSRYLGRSFVDKILKGKALVLDKNIEKYGFKVMTIMRLSFVFPYDPLSYAAGLTKMKYSDFIFGTLIGTLPEMVTYSLMGKNLEDPFSIKFILPIMILCIIAFCSLYVHRRISKNTNNL